MNLRNKEVKEFAISHLDEEGWRGDLNPGILTPESS